VSAQTLDRMDRARIAAHRLAHILLAVMLFVVGAALGLYVLLGAKGPADCAYTTDYLPSFPLFVWGGASLVMGHLLGRLDPRRPPRPTIGSKRMGHLALICVLALSVVIWFFEALGTAQVSASTANAASFEPITFYIRCAIYHDISSISSGAITVFVVFIVCVVLGHWLWGEE
jgi:hypothetical protein